FMSQPRPTTNTGIPPPGWRNVQAMVNDGRSALLQRILDRQFPEHAPEVAFYWLRNADLPSFTIACTLRQPGGGIPVFVVGLGCDMKLLPAIYKALIET